MATVFCPSFSDPEDGMGDVAILPTCGPPRGQRFRSSFYFVLSLDNHNTARGMRQYLPQLITQESFAFVSALGANKTAKMAGFI